MRRLSWSLSGYFFLALYGCNVQEHPLTVTVSGAASTRDALEQAAEAFGRTGVHVQVNAGASSRLAGQILAGAPADLFLSASSRWADEVAHEDPDSVSQTLFTNRLVLITPRGNPAEIHEPRDLLRESVRHVALAGEQVPAGIYAGQVLKVLNLYTPLTDLHRIVRGQNVRVALSYVEHGEADAGIVYATDARISERVETVYAFDTQLHDPIVYPLMLLAEGKTKSEAKAFYEYLLSREAQSIFQQHGFSPAETFLAARASAHGLVADHD